MTQVTFRNTFLGSFQGIYDLRLLLLGKGLVPSGQCLPQHTPISLKQLSVTFQPEVTRTCDQRVDDPRDRLQ